MNANWTALLRGLAETRLVRHAADAVLRARGRWDLVRFDRQAAARCQLRVLLGLVHQARRTRFGRDHDFRRVRTEADFRRLTPLLTRDDLQGAYGAPGDAWPVSPASSALHAARRGTLLTALALVTDASRRARLLSGRLLFLDGDAPAAEEWPLLIRPYTLSVPPLTPNPSPPRGEGGNWVDGAAAALARAPVTCLAGPLDRLVSVVEHVKKVAGRDRVEDVWPGLTAVIANHTLATESAAPLREALGERVLLLETAFLPEGPLAIRDPRTGCFRPLSDHGVYFEFTPAAERGQPAPTRHGLAEVEPGEVYEIALSSPAGVWACRTGWMVRFERRDPPSFQFVEAPALLPSLLGGEGVRGTPAPVTTPHPLQAPHRRIDDSPAGLPKTFVHSPWSAPADRG